MELGLTLGDRAVSKPPCVFMEKARDESNNKGSLGFCMALSVGNPNPRNKRKQEEDEQDDDDDDEEEEDYDTEDDQEKEKNMKKKRIKNAVFDDLHKGKIDSALVQLDLLPNTPVPRQNRHTLFSPSSHNGSRGYMGKGLDVNRVYEEAERVSCSPPNSGASSFQMDFCKSGNHHEGENRASSSRVSDEDENGSTRKKLRLSKQQSAFLEESFKEHTTLNPKQKLELAKQLDLRPRQVEVWFQNRRARTKLKQTEVDCENLKRYCETLKEENRRLHKEVQELRTLKSSNFYMQLPPTTLTMCPSCERVATTSTTATTTAATTTSIQPTDLSLSSRPRFHPFNQPAAF